MLIWSPAGARSIRAAVNDVTERPSLSSLAVDLAAEQADLVAVVSSLDNQGWATPTPAAGWTVRDQIAHLAYFDGTAALAATDPTAFAAMLVSPPGAPPPGSSATAGAPAPPAAVPGPDQDAPTSFEAITLRRELDGAATLAWWQRESAGLHHVIDGLEPSARIPWYGPPMSAMSMVTARIMETWAHGQDVCDALNVGRIATGRLRHVAHIGVRTLGFSYQVRGREAPVAPVRVELLAPGGETWSWGPAEAADTVRGTATDFCLLVTQRRHRNNTALKATGPVASEWLGLAQAYAGPPGPGREPLS